MRNLLVSSTLWLAIAFTTPILTADTITLKSGGTIEGKIISETDTSVVVEVKVSSSITDRKTIAKEDVAEIVKTTKDSIAFKALVRYKLEGNSLQAATYQAIIDKKLKPFLAEHPDSPHRAAVEKVLADFEAEQARVEAGEFKIDGKWLSAAEVAEQQYELDALVAYREMRAIAKRGDLVAAMNRFELFDKEFEGSQKFPDAVVLAQKVINAFNADLVRKNAQYDRDLAKWERGYELALAEKKAPLKMAREAEQKRYDTIISEAKLAGTLWVPLIPKSKTSLEELAKASDKTSREIKTVKLALIRSSIEKTDKAKAAITSKKFASASEYLADARKLWGKNAEAKRLSEDLPEMLTALEERKNQAAIAAEAEAKAAEEKKQAAAKAEAKAKSQAAKTDGEGTKSSAASEDAKKPFYQTVPGAAGIVVLVVAILGIVAKFGQAKPAKRQE